MEEKKAEHTLVFPTPSASSFTIQAEGSFHYTISDQTGRIVEKGSGKDSVQTGEEFTTGMYIVTILTEKVTIKIKTKLNE